MADYQVFAWMFSDFDGQLTNAFNASTITTGNHAVGTSSTLAFGASQVSFFVTDDGLNFGDAHVEAGALSVLTNDLTLNGVTYPAGSSIKAAYALSTNDSPPNTIIIGRIGADSGSYGNNLLVFSLKALSPGQTLTFASTADGTADLNITICFARGTTIETPHGEQLIQDLQPGDEVTTRDGAIETIAWIGSRKLSGFDLARNPHLAPVRIRRNAMGPNRPTCDLVVSPQHRILIDDWRSELLFGEDEVLVPARTLINDRDVMVDQMQCGVEYFHILLENHQLVCANGQWSESLMPDQNTLKTLTPQQIEEIHALRPDFFEGDVPCYVATFPAVAARPARVLAA